MTIALDIEDMHASITQVMIIPSGAPGIDYIMNIRRIGHINII